MVVHIWATINGKTEELYVKLNSGDQADEFLHNLPTITGVLIHAYNANNRLVVINTSTVIKAWRDE